MFHPSESGSTHQPASESQPTTAPRSPITLPVHNQDVLRMFLLGDSGSIRNMISRLATHGIADATSWTPLQHTGRDGEYITVHTKRKAAATRDK